MQNKDESCLRAWSWIARGLTKERSSNQLTRSQKAPLHEGFAFSYASYLQRNFSNIPKLLLSYCFVHEQLKSQHRNFHQFSNQWKGSLKSLREMEKKTNLVAKGIPVEFAHEEQHMLSLFNWMLKLLETEAYWSSSYTQIQKEPNSYSNKVNGVLNFRIPIKFSKQWSY
jgi:hypothetical protein